MPASTTTAAATKTVTLDAPPLSPKVDEYVSTNLRYVAKLKLQKLTEADLRELCRRLAKKLNAPCHNSALLVFKKHELIEAAMDFKKQLLLKQTAPMAVVVDQVAVEEADGEVVVVEELPSVEERVVVQPPDIPEDGEDKAEEAVLVMAPPPPPERFPIVQSVEAVEPMHALRICSWNSLELRIGDVKSKAEDNTYDGDVRRKYWMSLAQHLSEYDVIIMQEVLASEARNPKRTKQFTELLHMPNGYVDEETPVTWQLYFSDPSGKDGKTAGARVHVHALWVRSPIKVTRVRTLRAVGGTQLDYAPLQVALHDPRFADPDDRNFVLTSVHLPPNSRASSRDAQLKKLISCYAALDTSEYRMNAPYGLYNPVGLNPPTHILCGDFNCFPGALKKKPRRPKAAEEENADAEDDIAEGEELYGITRHGLVPLLPEEAATSQGRQHYDNYLIDAHSKKKLLISHSILPLNRHDAGLSDHDPIICTIEEARAIKSKAAKKKNKSKSSKESTSSTETTSNKESTSSTSSTEDRDYADVCGESACST